MTNKSVNDMNFSIMSSFSGSKTVYVAGSRPDIKVPMREIELSPTTGTFGEEINHPVRVYDTSGPYTDSKATVDIRNGLNPVRRNWSLNAEMSKRMRVVRFSLKIMAFYMGIRGQI